MNIYFIFPIFSLLFLTAGCGLWGSSQFSELPSYADAPRPGPKKTTADGPPPQKQVDILFVVDANPELMDVYLKNVHQSFKGFIPALSEVDWKIGFTNADYDPAAGSYYRHDLLAGKIMPLENNHQELTEKALYFKTPKNEPIFLNTLKRFELKDAPRQTSIRPCDLPPYCHSQAKNPVQSLIQAVSVNPGFFRENSYAAAVIITNGDEQTISGLGANDPGVNPVGMVHQVGAKPGRVWLASPRAVQNPPPSLALSPRQEAGRRLTSLLDQAFLRHYGPRRKLKVYSISIIPNDAFCLNQSASQHLQNLPEIAYSHTIYEVVMLTKGRMISICSPNYTALAKALSDIE